MKSMHYWILSDKIFDYAGNRLITLFVDERISQVNNFRNKSLIILCSLELKGYMEKMKNVCLYFLEELSTILNVEKLVECCFSFFCTAVNDFIENELLPKWLKEFR
ncbi:hypothetical protein [Carnobacterium divergens]|uniref:hypothetical protein n=1 Tax=Carnobacterium divergens TaxID=2748 RepID=UPI0039AF7507